MRSSGVGFILDNRKRDFGSLSEVVEKRLDKFRRDNFRAPLFSGVVVTDKAAVSIFGAWRAKPEKITPFKGKLD